MTRVATLRRHLRRSPPRDLRVIAPLVAMLPAGLLAGTLLAIWWGAPRVPSALRLWNFWDSPSAAAGELAVVLAALTWLTLGYLILSVSLRMLLLVARRRVDGRVWRSALRLSTTTMLAPVRLRVDAAMAPLARRRGPVSGAGRATPLSDHGRLAWEVTAAPAPAELPSTVVPSAGAEALPQRAVPSIRSNACPGELRSYLVEPGDDAWGIAERMLGDGFRWVEIWELNRGRAMETGRTFVDPNRLSPGWMLLLPAERREQAAPGGGTARAGAAGSEPVGGAPGERPSSAGDGRGSDGHESPPSVREPSSAEPSSAGASSAGHDVRDQARPAPSGDVSPARSGATWPEMSTGLGSPAREQGALDEPERWEWPSARRDGVVTAAGAAALGGVSALVERARALVPRRRRSGGGQGPSDAARIALATSALRAALADRGVPGARLVLVHEADDGIGFTLSSMARHGPVLLELAPEPGRMLRGLVPELGRLLGCEVSVEHAATLSPTIKLSGFRSTAELIRPAIDRPYGPPMTLLVPLGASPRGVVYLDLAAAEGVALIGAGEAQRQLLRSWLATLDATHAPGALAIRVGESAALLFEAERMPAGPTGPSEAAGLVTILGPEDRRDEASSAPLAAAVIRCLPEDADRGASPGSTARIVLRSEGEPGRLSDGRGASGAALSVRVDGGQPLLLEPVQVRRRGRERPAGSPPPSTDLAEPGASVMEAPGSPDRADGRRPDGPQRGGGQLPDDHGRPGSAPAWPAVIPISADTSADTPANTPANTSADSARGSEAASGKESSTMITTAGQRDPSDLGEPAPGAAGPGAAGPSDAVRGDDGPLFTVKCFGRLEVRNGATPIESWDRSKARELFCVLAAQGGHDISREAVAEMMWPGYPYDKSVRHLVSNAMSGLRTTLRQASGLAELQPIAGDGTRDRLQRSLFSVDLDAFESGLRRAAGLPDREALDEYQRAFDRYGDKYLAGESYSWVESYRFGYLRRLVAGASRAAAIAERQGERELAAGFYQLILEQDPTDEAAARGRMRQLAMAGDINGARKVLLSLTAALQAELCDAAAAPSQDTRALLAELLADEERGAA